MLLVLRRAGCVTVRSPSSSRCSTPTCRTTSRAWRPPPLPLRVLGRTPRRLPRAARRRPRGRRSPRSRRRAAGGGSGSGTARACSGCSRVSRSCRRAPTTQPSRCCSSPCSRSSTSSCGDARACVASGRDRAAPRSGSSCCSNAAPNLVYMRIHGQDTDGRAPTPVRDRVRGSQDLPARPAGGAAPRRSARRPAGEEHEVHAHPQRARAAARHHRRRGLRRPHRHPPPRHPSRSTPAGRSGGRRPRPGAGGGAAAARTRC